ncbi:hypothetical protein CYMTET_8451 [Cymbomonas tetramitiformis]|uniref:Uncharacterized protein n=1 Tax=Cymbomonas tetramitiformis TaxID=36881 RepID=A0AAE0GTQ0_9CHLO|nr:hypothetical protein CYMTET_8451 [Cymbomonas tetramitiformis]
MMVCQQTNRVDREKRAQSPPYLTRRLGMYSMGSKVAVEALRDASGYATVETLPIDGQKILSLKWNTDEIRENVASSIEKVRNSAWDLPGSEREPTGDDLEELRTLKDACSCRGHGNADSVRCKRCTIIQEASFTKVTVFNVKDQWLVSRDDESLRKFKRQIKEKYFQYLTCDPPDKVEILVNGENLLESDIEDSMSKTMLRIVNHDTPCTRCEGDCFCRPLVFQLEIHGRREGGGKSPVSPCSVAGCPVMGCNSIAHVCIKSCYFPSKIRDWNDGIVDLTLPERRETLDDCLTVDEEREGIDFGKASRTRIEVNGRQIPKDNLTMKHVQIPLFQAGARKQEDVPPIAFDRVRRIVHCRGLMPTADKQELSDHDPLVAALKNLGQPLNLNRRESYVPPVETTAVFRRKDPGGLYSQIVDSLASDGSTPRRERSAQRGATSQDAPLEKLNLKEARAVYVEWIRVNHMIEDADTRTNHADQVTVLFGGEAWVKKSKQRGDEVDADAETKLGLDHCKIGRLFRGIYFGDIYWNIERQKCELAHLDAGAATPKQPNKRLSRTRKPSGNLHPTEEPLRIAILKGAPELKGFYTVKLFFRPGYEDTEGLGAETHTSEAARIIAWPMEAEHRYRNCGDGPERADFAPPAVEDGTLYMNGGRVMDVQCSLLGASPPTGPNVRCKVVPQDEWQAVMDKMQQEEPVSLEWLPFQFSSQGGNSMPEERRLPESGTRGPFGPLTDGEYTVVVAKRSGLPCLKAAQGGAGWTQDLEKSYIRRSNREQVSLTLTLTRSSGAGEMDEELHTGAPVPLSHMRSGHFAFSLPARVKDAMRQPGEYMLRIAVDDEKTIYKKQPLRLQALDWRYTVELQAEWCSQWIGCFHAGACATGRSGCPERKRVRSSPPLRLGEDSLPDVYISQKSGTLQNVPFPAEAAKQLQIHLETNPDNGRPHKQLLGEYLCRKDGELLGTELLVRGAKLDPALDVGRLPWGDSRAVRSDEVLLCVTPRRDGCYLEEGMDLMKMVLPALDVPIAAGKLMELRPSVAEGSGLDIRRQTPSSSVYELRAPLRDNVPLAIQVHGFDRWGNRTNYIKGAQAGAHANEIKAQLTGLRLQNGKESAEPYERHVKVDDAGQVELGELRPCRGRGGHGSVMLKLIIPGAEARHDRAVVIKGRLAHRTLTLQTWEKSEWVDCKKETNLVGGVNTMLFQAGKRYAVAVLEEKDVDESVRDAVEVSFQPARMPSRVQPLLLEAGRCELSGRPELRFPELAGSFHLVMKLLSERELRCDAVIKVTAEAGVAHRVEPLKPQAFRAAPGDRLKLCFKAWDEYDNPTTRLPPGLQVCELNSEGEIIGESWSYDEQASAPGKVDVEVFGRPRKLSLALCAPSGTPVAATGGSRKRQRQSDATTVHNLCSNGQCWGVVVKPGDAVTGTLLCTGHDGGLIEVPDCSSMPQVVLQLHDARGHLATDWDGVKLALCSDPASALMPPARGTSQVVSQGEANFGAVAVDMRGVHQRKPGEEGSMTLTVKIAPGSASRQKGATGKKGGWDQLLQMVELIQLKVHPSARPLKMELYLTSGEMVYHGDERKLDAPRRADDPLGLELMWLKVIGEEGANVEDVSLAADPVTKISLQPVALRASRPARQATVLGESSQSTNDILGRTERVEAADLPPSLRQSGNPRGRPCAWFSVPGAKLPPPHKTDCALTITVDLREPTSELVGHLSRHRMPRIKFLARMQPGQPHVVRLKEPLPVNCVTAAPGWALVSPRDPRQPGLEVGVHDVHGNHVAGVKWRVGLWLLGSTGRDKWVVRGSSEDAAAVAPVEDGFAKFAADHMTVPQDMPEGKYALAAAVMWDNDDETEELPPQRLEPPLEVLVKHPHRIEAEGQRHREREERRRNAEVELQKSEKAMEDAVFQEQRCMQAMTAIRKDQDANDKLWKENEHAQEAFAVHGRQAPKPACIRNPAVEVYYRHQEALRKADEKANGCRGRELVGVVKDLVQAECEDVARGLADYLGGNAAILITRTSKGGALLNQLKPHLVGQHLSAQTLQDIREFNNGVDNQAPQCPLRLPTPVPAPRRGFRGHAVNLVRLPPGNEGLRQTLLYHFFGDALVFDDDRAMEAYVDLRMAHNGGERHRGGLIGLPQKGRDGRWGGTSCYKPGGRISIAGAPAEGQERVLGLAKWWSGESSGEEARRQSSHLLDPRARDIWSAQQQWNEQGIDKQEMAGRVTKCSNELEEAEERRVNFEATRNQNLKTLQAVQREIEPADNEAQTACKRRRKITSRR